MTLRNLVLLLVSGLAGALLLTACNSSAKQINSNNPPVVNGHALPLGPDGAARITLADAKQAIDKGDAVIVDVRPLDAYKQEHIKGSISIPADQTGSRVKELPTNKLVIAYCSCPTEHTSVGAVQMYNNNGYHNSAALVGGTNGWKTAGYPMSTGSEP